MNEKKSLKCPFTWHIDEKLTSQYDENDELEVSVQVQPVVSLMKSIMSTYAKVVQKNYELSHNNLKKTDEIWDQIINYKKSEINDDKISIDVLLHIKEATKFFVLKKVNSPKANEILNNITNSTDFKSKIEIATVEGCQSIFWLFFHEHAIEKAMIHVKLAYDNSPDCALWNFTLGKALRRMQRLETFSNTVTESEKRHFLKSYELSRNSFYAIKVAEMYRENGEYDKAKELHVKIYNEKPSDVGIMLTLIKSFISYKDFPKAKACIDLVEKSIPHNSALLHYKGMYFEKQGDYRQAVKHLEQATKNAKNFMAEMTYIRCMIKLYQKKFDYAGFLQKIVDKYDEPCYKQKILLDLAMCYFKKKDFYNAGLHLWQSIQLNPENKLLKSYYSFDKKGNINIFDFIKKDLIPKLQQSNKHFANCEPILKNFNDMFNEFEVSNRLLSNALEEIKLN